MPRGEDIASLAVLAEPSRRRVYDHVVATRQPVTKDDVALALGIGRTLAGYHLDRLVTSGLLSASYARLTGKTGPGAGRTAKLYTASMQEFSASEPARDYEALARLLAASVAGDHSEQRKAQQAAHTAGIAVGRRERGRTPSEVLTERGYAPYSDEGHVRLANCPFHRLAQEHRELVCGINRALIQGLLEGMGAASLSASLDPRPGQCCVALFAA